MGGKLTGDRPGGCSSLFGEVAPSIGESDSPFDRFAMPEDIQLHRFLPPFMPLLTRRFPVI